MKVLYSFVLLAVGLVAVHAVDCTVNGPAQTYPLGHVGDLGPFTVDSGDGNCICMPWTTPPDDPTDCSTAGLFGGKLFRIHDHPAGFEAEPGYGLRIDGILSGNGKSDTQTFSFDNTPGTIAWMDVKPEGIHLFGYAFGGKDIGSSIDPASATRMFFDFTFPEYITITSNTTYQDGYYLFENTCQGILQFLDNDKKFFPMHCDSRADGLYAGFHQNLRSSPLGGEAWVNVDGWSKTSSRDFLFEIGLCHTDLPETDPDSELCDLLNREAGTNRYNCGACKSGSPVTSHALAKCV